MPEASSTAQRAWRRIGDGVLSPVTASLVLSFIVVALIIVVTGTNPWTAYTEMWRGATSGSGPRTVVNRAIPIVGMAIALSIPFRAGILNLGGEGQMVTGGLAAALTAIYMPGPGVVVIVVAMLAGAVTGAVWALLPALGQTYLKLPILISSLLLNAPARALTSYLVKYYFGDEKATSTTTVQIPESTKIPTLESLSGASATLFLVLAIVAMVAVFNKRTSPGYESFMSGLNLKFARYGGVDVRRQTIGTMVVGGAIAGVVGSHIVLGQAFRFVDNDLAGTGFAWTGLLVTLLAAHRPVPALFAGIFFAALQVGGLAMQRSADVSWQLAQVLQAVVILALAMRLVIVRRRTRSGPPGATLATDPHEDTAPSAMATAKVVTP
jgi:simple sugar transport system permease protein